jgi:hypothetical protein
MIVDENGNYLKRVNDKIYLKLSSEERARKIGSISDECIFVTYRDSKKHLHNKTNSYGFNYEFLKASTKIEKIRLETNHGTYLFPLQLVKDEGNFGFYKQQGFEVQVFLSMEIIQNYKI